MKKNFYNCFSILTGIYLCGTLLYYSQMYLLYDYYDEAFIGSMISGWSYIAQAIGIILYMVLGRLFSDFTYKRHFQAAMNLLLLPISALSIMIHDGNLLTIMVLCLNAIIGLQTAYAFSLIAIYVAPKNRALCFGLSYSIGGIGTWMISKIDKNILLSYRVLFIAAIIIAIVDVYIINYQDASVTDESSSTETSLISSINYKYIPIIITLMAIVTALGNGDSFMVSSGMELSFLTTRLFYACGLLIAAFIFDHNPTLGGICSLASLMYPLIVIILYQEFPANLLIVGLTDTFAAFYTVYRAGIYFHHPDKSMAPVGLLFSRVVEGIMIIVITSYHFNHMILFLTSAIILVPLIIIFGLIQSKGATLQNVVQEESKEETIIDSHASFVEANNLTRREEEIFLLLVSGKTNKEISSELFVSESTVRFHVSNILKKTGYENRNKLRQAYNINK